MDMGETSVLPLRRREAVAGEKGIAYQI